MAGRNPAYSQEGGIPVPRIRRQRIAAPHVFLHTHLFDTDSDSDPDFTSSLFTVHFPLIPTCHEPIALCVLLSLAIS